MLTLVRSCRKIPNFNSRITSKRTIFLRVTDDAKVCLVVGVGPGIGSHVARRFAAEGFTIGLVAREEETARALNSELSLEGYNSDFIAADVGQENQYNTFARIHAQFGIPSVIIYTAHDHLKRQISEVSPEMVQKSMQSTAIGAYYTAQFAAREMTKKGKGTLIFLGSLLGGHSLEYYTLPGVGQFSIRGVAEGASRELGPKGVHVAHLLVDGNTFIPGGFGTFR
eukprot:TRINITY_DN2096_c0_g1_i2.p1 TRINITY_DN2096_c0_g1~~TRINITY_DN2096_c0_g1_i2.p1  ORF type:complete len:225 (+),score=44.82 TRINITY_DN2096_c0_g1_i2:601-1275(+)